MEREKERVKCLTWQGMRTMAGCNSVARKQHCTPAIRQNKCKCRCAHSNIQREMMMKKKILKLITKLQMDVIKMWMKEGTQQHEIRTNSNWWSFAWNIVLLLYSSLANSATRSEHSTMPASRCAIIHLLLALRLWRMKWATNLWAADR